MTVQLRSMDENYPVAQTLFELDSDDVFVSALVRAPSEQDANTSVEPIDHLLSSFESYQLDDLSNANLMNRVDSKFILPMSFLPELLGELKSMYRVLDIAGKRCFSYYNQYLDTPAMDLYQAHHNGKLNRYKVRRRCYVDTATEYLEVKLKNNQKRTVKTRIKLSTDKNNDADCLEFLAQEMHGKYADLHVIQQGGYKRMAFANEEKAERLTLDFDLWYNNNDSDNQVKLPGFFIAELKQSKISKSSPFYQLMSKHHIFPTSFSKYCIGCALLYPNQIKVNQFKSVLSRIKQLHRCEPLLPAESN